MILCKQTVDVHASRADGELTGPARTRRRGDLKCVWSRGRVNSAAQHVESPGLKAAVEFRQPLIPVRVQLDATLLHDNPGVVLPGIKGEPAVVKAHRSLQCCSFVVSWRGPSVLVNDSEFQSDRQILLHPHAQIDLPWGSQ